LGACSTGVREGVGTCSTGVREGVGACSTGMREGEGAFRNVWLCACDCPCVFACVCLRDAMLQCTFGILKSRWRTLKVPSSFQMEERVDAVFHTCCILHNMLLDWADLSAIMVQDARKGMLRAQQVYEDLALGGIDGQHEPARCGHRKLLDGRVVTITSSFDASSVGSCLDLCTCQMHGQDYVVAEYENTWLELRTLLKVHFTFRYVKQRSIVWPSSKRKRTD